MVDLASREEINKNLREIAMDDGRLSVEERELISIIISDIEKYSKLIQKAKENGLISTMDENRLFENRMKILENAYEKAREDSVISDDEQKLLKEICSIIREIR